MSQSPAVQTVPQPSLSPQTCPGTARSIFPCLAGQLLTAMALLGLTQPGWVELGLEILPKGHPRCIGRANTVLERGAQYPGVPTGLEHGCCPTFGHLGSRQPGPDQAVPLPEAQDLHLGELRHVGIQLLLQVPCRGHRVTPE